VRTLVGAAEPEPRRPNTAGAMPYPSWSMANTTSTSVLSLNFVVTGTEAAAVPVEPYRTTAYVGRPVPEVEA